MAAKTLLVGYEGGKLALTGRGFGLPGENVGVNGEGVCFIGQQLPLYTLRL